MKKSIVLLVITVFLCIIMDPMAAFAQKGKESTKLFYNRTNMAISKAREAVQSGKIYSGDLVKAVFHQRLARAMYERGKYESAIHHSNRARFLAFEAIKINKREVTADLEHTLAEKDLIKNLPDNRTLDAEIKIPEGVNDKSILDQKEEDIKEDK